MTPHPDKPPWPRVGTRDEEKPWLRGAKFIAVKFSAGFLRIGLSRPDRLRATNRTAQRHHRLSAFYEMP
jgi:hypothetical protein